jgi:hypothetical protein
MFHRTFSQWKFSKKEKEVILAAVCCFLWRSHLLRLKKGMKKLQAACEMDSILELSQEII